MPESGLSDDYYTTFYYYDGSNIQLIDIINGSYFNFHIDGSGNLFTKSRASILQTWFYTDEYRLDESHKLINVPQNYYRMNTVVTAKKRLVLQKSITDTTNGLILEPGERAVILLTDNEKWCMVLNSKGETGWFWEEDYNIMGLDHSSDVFDGLCFAD